MSRRQKLFATHKNKIPYGESSQIDGLEAGKITFKDYHLICWVKVVFLTTNKLRSSQVILPAINLTNSTKGDLVGQYQGFYGGTKFYPRYAESSQRNTLLGIKLLYIYGKLWHSFHMSREKKGTCIEELLCTICHSAM